MPYRTIRTSLPWTIAIIPSIVLIYAFYGEKLFYDPPRFTDPVVERLPPPGGYLRIRWTVQKHDDCPGSVQAWAMETSEIDASGRLLAQFPLSWPMGDYQRAAEYPIPPDFHPGETWYLAMLLDHRCGFGHSTRQRLEPVAFTVVEP